MNKKKIIYATVIVLVVAVVTIVITKTRNNALDVKLETIKIGRASISNTVTATGTLEASVTVAVGTQVSGRINRLYADFNDNVKKGQLLAVIDTEALMSTLESTRASLDLAQAEYDFQRSIYERNEKLIEKKLIAQTDFDQTLYNYKSAQANLKSAQARYKTAQTDLEYAYIYSPIDGVVLERVVEEGETVAASYATPELFTIANDLSQMEIEADVDEADIGQLKEGQRVEFTVDAYPDKIFNGLVTEIQLMPEESSNVVTYTVVIKASNPEKILMPGMTASVTFFVTEKKNILVIPNQAFEFIPNMELIEAYKKTNPDIHFQLHPEEKEGNRLPEANDKMPEPAFDGSRVTPDRPELDENMKMIWVLNNNTVSPRIVEVGETDEINYELISGVEEGNEIVLAMTLLNSKNNVQDNQQIQSPFMPKPPGANRKK